jgi:signal transduction histidine kinase
MSEQNHKMMTASSISIRILLIEDNIAEARLLHEILAVSQFNQFNLVHVKRLQEALEQLNQNEFDVILLDLTLPDSQGLGSLAPLLAKAPNLPIVVLTNTNDDELALEAVRRGAQDYLIKRHVNINVLVRSVRYAIERKQALGALQAVNDQLNIRVQQRNAELIEAKEVNQLKSELVSMISHDFRNPMNTILLSAGLLEDNADQLTKEKKISYFQLIHSAIDDMARLLDEVLIIGKADAGKLQYHPSIFNLEDFCHQLIEQIQLSIGKKHQLVFTTKGELGEAQWDENLLKHILGNLLANAIKYSPEGSTVSLELVIQAQSVILSIQDQGIGIPLAEQELLFQAFNRASNVGKIPGHGLGLAIVRKCVEVHGGQITFESNVGVGTKFQVTLPLNTMVKYN